MRLIITEVSFTSILSASELAKKDGIPVNMIITFTTASIAKERAVKGSAQKNSLSSLKIKPQNQKSIEKKAFIIYKKKLIMAFTAIEISEIINIPQNFLSISIVHYY
jgi:hypothetical protein